MSLRTFLATAAFFAVAAAASPCQTVAPATRWIAVGGAPLVSLGFASDGQRLVAGAADGGVTLLDAREGTVLRSLPGGVNGPNAVATAANGELSAVASRDRLLLRGPDGSVRRELPAPAALQVGFDPSGKLVAAACADGGLRIWDAASGAGPRTLFCGAICFAFAEGGGVLAAGTSDGKVALFAASAFTPGPGASADLRPNYERWQLPPRRQGQRGTCSVFTTTATYEYALSRRQDRGTPLSEEFLNWAANDATGRIDDGSFFHEIVAGFDKYGACRLELMPYRREWDPKLRPDAKALEDAAATRALGFTVHWINPWKPQAGLTSEHLAAIKQVLARGWPVALGSSHSTLAVGYTDDPAVPGGGSIWIRDSATGGYRTLTCEFVQSRIGDVFWVEPVQPGH